MTWQSEIEEILKEFARQNNLEAVCFGNIDECKDCYILLCGEDYSLNLNFEDKVTDLDMQLFPDSGASIIAVPLGKRSIKDFPRCLYKRK